MKVICNTDEAKFYWLWEMTTQNATTGDLLHLACELVVGVIRGNTLTGLLAPAVEDLMPTVNRRFISCRIRLQIREVVGSYDFMPSAREMALRAQLQHAAYPDTIRNCEDLQALAPSYLYVLSRREVQRMTRVNCTAFFQGKSIAMLAEPVYGTGDVNFPELLRNRKHDRPLLAEHYTGIRNGRDISRERIERVQ